MIVVPPQQRFLESVLATLPKRHRHQGTVGDWPKGKGLLFEPPEPGLDGSPVTVESMCLVGVFVWAPTLMYKEEACRLSDKGQAPCPHCGFNSRTIHKTWSKPRCAVVLLNCLPVSRCYVSTQCFKCAECADHNSTQGTCTRRRGISGELHRCTFARIAKSPSRPGTQVCIELLSLIYGDFQMSP